MVVVAKVQTMISVSRIRSASMSLTFVPSLAQCRRTWLHSTSRVNSRHVCLTLQRTAFGYSVSSFTAGQRSSGRNRVSKSSLRHRALTMSSQNQRDVLLAIGNGSEEIEAATVGDILVRAGAKLTVASVEQELTVRMSRGMKFTADKLISDVADCDYDMIVLPGGMPGAERLRDSQALLQLLRKAISSKDSDSTGNTVIAAICAAPAVVLSYHGLLENRDATCYPAGPFTDAMHHVSDGNVVESADGKFITSRGPGTAMAFALRCVEKLYGKSSSEKIGKALLYSC